ncbi:serine/threonine-protein kinase [Noviherbaspirillum massiliense]|uniref:serine/threonine-protein kinase n=1 Tax=Noviherbaspirillum massiliense TaxID=1465823 RepID=UPI00030DD94F|nr:serine/threonine-protein kinase [Noviherbaspirillum massiliense]
MQNTLPLLQQDTISAGSENCLPVGTRLADFEITGIIGEGGFGIVYLAFDHSLQRTVAIKEYMPGMFASRGADKSVIVRSQRDQETFGTGLKSFINEARLLAQFDHPALIKVYRFWEENNTGYMAMRYYEGQTLKNVVKKDPARVTEAWLKSVLKPILEALETLYRVNVLHRDISPDNIMIQNTGEAVLLDFGAARQIIGDMAHAFTVILKPGYAPIEQYADDAGMKQGPWTDIYSLCAVIYSVIAKKLPPTSVARSIKDPIELLQNGDYPGFSKEFLAAIDKGLSVKPEDRPQSIEEFRQLLKLEGAMPIPIAIAPDMFRSPSSGGTVDAKPARVKARTNRKPANVLLAISIAGVVCGLGAVGYFLFKQKPAQPVAVVTGASESNSASSEPGAGLPAAVAEAQPDEETAAWVALANNPNAKADDFTAFIGKYPEGKHAEAARARLAAFQSTATAAQPVARAAAPAAVKQAQPMRSKPSAAKPASGVVKLNVKPWGTVDVDGVSKGVSPPLKQLVLPEGKHYIKLTNPSSPNYIIEVDVKKNKAVKIEYDFSPRKK